MSEVVGPDAGSLLVRTYRDGMAAMVGHDLVLEVTEWSATVTMDPDQPDACEVTVTAQAGSLRVREGTGGAKPLSQKDIGDIEKSMREKVLSAGRHPEITFKSNKVSASVPARKGTVRGELTLCGATHPAGVEVEVEDEGSAWHARGSATIVQTTWGIKPYSALLGALRVKDAVEVGFDVRVPRKP